MTLEEMINEVYIKTNRPDLVEQTQSAVVSSTLAMHSIDFFYKDIKTAQLVFDNTNYLQALETSYFVRWRSLSYFRKNDPSFAPYQQNPILSSIPQDYWSRTKFMKILTPDDILDDYEIEKVDVAFQAGSTIYAKSSTPLRYALMGFYQYPNLDTSDDGVNFDSWIARELPWVIVYDATSTILQSIGMTDAARKYDSPNGGLVTVWKEILIKNNILPNGS